MRPLKRFRTSRAKRRGRPRILIVTPEITELPEGMGNAANYIRAKGGGLGDISAALIDYLFQDDRFELHVAMPKYDRKIRGFSRASQREVDSLIPRLQRKGVHLITDSTFAELTDIYADSVVHPRIRRAEALQRHVINQLLDELRPDVVHCNDWMTGLIPAAARERGLKSLFTVHNVFTEKATPADLDASGISVRRFTKHLYFTSFPSDTPDNWFGNKVDFLATGIWAADVVNTVSPTFLKEIVNGYFEGIIPPPIRHAIREKHGKGQARGILNAPGDIVDPRIMPGIRQFGIDDVVEGKRDNRLKLQQILGLDPDPDAALFFWPSRLYSQKGPELLFSIGRDFVQARRAQIAIVGNGTSEAEREAQRMQSHRKGKIAYHKFDEDLSDLGKAGADFILMPSLYEPCGLPQMEGPRFGTLAVARTTGGLSDTVTELDVGKSGGNGFTFDWFRAEDLAAAMARAVAFRLLPEEVRRPHLQRIMRDAFDRFSLARTAANYVQVYQGLMEEPVVAAAPEVAPSAG